MPKLFVVQQYEIFANVLENYKLGYQYENLLFVQVTNGLLINTHCPPVFLCVVATLSTHLLISFVEISLGQYRGAHATEIAWPFKLVAGEGTCMALIVMAGLIRA